MLFIIGFLFNIIALIIALLVVNYIINNKHELYLNLLNFRNHIYVINY